MIARQRLLMVPPSRHRPGVEAMSGGGKSFNIWIAYSDLFTNLSTFLFISALGVFAAIGSGVMVSVGQGSRTECSLPKGISQSLTADNSLLEALGNGISRANGDEDCSQYFRVDGYSFKSADPASFSDERGHRPVPDELLRRLCQPIWLTLSLRTFDDVGGEISFVGVAEASNKPTYPGRCSAKPRGDPQIDGFPSTKVRSAISVIRECQISGVSAYPAVCQDVLNCLKRKQGDRNGWCGKVAAAEQRGRQADLACAKAEPQQQATALYDVCESAPLNRNFPNQLFSHPNMVAGANTDDGLRALWGRVGVDALIRDGPVPTDAAARTLLPPELQQAAGSVLIKVSATGHKRPPAP